MTKKKRLTATDKAFFQGTAIAVATLKVAFGDSTEVRELMKVFDLNRANCIRHRVDEADMDTFEPIWRAQENPDDPERDAEDGP